MFKKNYVNQMWEYGQNVFCKSYFEITIFNKFTPWFELFLDVELIVGLVLKLVSKCHKWWKSVKFKFGFATKLVQLAWVVNPSWNPANCTHNYSPVLCNYYQIIIGNIHTGSKHFISAKHSCLSISSELVHQTFRKMVMQYHYP